MAVSASNLLYGLRRHHPDRHPPKYFVDTVSYDYFYQGIARYQLPRSSGNLWPRGFQFFSVDRYSSGRLGVEFIFRPSGWRPLIIQTKLLLRERRITVAYHNHLLYNEKAVVTALASMVADDDVALELVIAPKRARQGASLWLEDGFIDRYPAGWRLHHNDSDHRLPEAEQIKLLAEHTALDQRTRATLLAEPSLGRLLSSSSGRQALLRLNDNHHLHLRRPLSDLRLNLLDG